MFLILCSFGEILKNVYVGASRGLAPPPTKILDPPFISINTTYFRTDPFDISQWQATDSAIHKANSRAASFIHRFNCGIGHGPPCHHHEFVTA